MIPLDFALAIPAITLLLYTPLVCYLDWTERRVDHRWWLGLVLINAPLFVFQFIAGVYQWWMPLISLVAIVLAFAAMKLHYIEGADFMFIMFIVLFLQYNPVTGHWLMALPFFIFLASMLVITTATIIWFSILSGGFQWGVDTITGENGFRFPMMFQISAALILTILLA